MMRRFLGLAACFAFGASAHAQTSAPKPADAASAATRVANEAVAAALPLEDIEDEGFADRGFIATWPDAQIRTADGRVAWDFSAYANLDGAAPPTVNPSLWRHARLLARHGLFKVTDRLYQVRGFDISNMSIIVGDTGLIIVDPLTTVDVARAALTLARRDPAIGAKPVKAVIYTHSHGDHFGGVRGVVEQADVDAGRVAIIAPDGFVEHAVSENAIAGGAMSRRATYQFGVGLSPGPAGQMSSGIGLGLSVGALSLIPPTISIARTGERRTIDGVDFVFQVTPNTEAPSEMNFHLPQLRALCLAENANVSMHNVLTPRGALVRDSKAWADYLTQSLRLYGRESDVMFTSHGWPRWGQDRVADFIASHRDAYKYLHDQSVRLMNKGQTGAEIAEEIALPEALAKRWFNRGYYGTMRHNSRAVYQRYMGWYDGNPAHLNGLPPEESARRYVKLMGGSARVIAEARRAMGAGDYRWAAELLDRVVFAEPSNVAAKSALAEAQTQMGYQSESAIWRNMYLSAAKELRDGVAQRPTTAASLDLIRNTPTGLLFDLLAVRLDPAKATAAPLRLAFVFPERRERFMVTIRNGVLVHEADVVEAVDATVTLPRAAFLQAMFMGSAPAAQIDGDGRALARFFTLFDTPPPDFPIVTP